VESEGRQTKPGETSAPASNVVRLPRDWLGPKDWLEPRDELVPLGPAASQAPGPDALPAGLGPDEEQPPVGADAFWSEGSAAIQDALQAPGWGAAWGQDGTEDADAEPTGAAGAGTAGSAGDTRRVGRAALRSSAFVRAFPFRKRVLLGAGAVALVCLVSLIGALGSAPAGRRLASAESSPPSISTSPEAPRILAPRHPQSAGPARATERRHPHTPVSRKRPTAAHGRSAASTATQTVAVIHTVAARPSVSQATSSPTPVSASSDASANSGGGVSSRSAPSSSTPAPGPAGPGAPFGPGHLG
jgi:hypothetical protein